MCHSYHTVISLLILFGYSLISFGAHNEKPLSGVTVNGRAVSLVTFPDSSFPEDSGEETKMKFFPNSKALILELQKNADPVSNMNIGVSGGLQFVQGLLTDLKSSSCSALRLAPFEGESGFSQYNLEYTSVLSAAKKFNQLLEKELIQGLEPITFTDAQKEILEQRAANKAAKNRNKSLVLLIPVVGGVAACVLVGPAVLLANIAALCCNLVAMGISLGVAFLSLAIGVGSVVVGVGAPIAIPLMILRDIFMGPKK